MTDITQRQGWKKKRRLRQYWGQTLAKTDQYNKPATKGVVKETWRLIRVARTINPRRHLRRISYRIDYDLVHPEGANFARKIIMVRPKSSPFVIAHELGHLMPDRGATRLEEEAKATRHALRILQAAGYKGQALRRMRAQAMAAYETHRIAQDPDAAYARIMQNPIGRLYPPHKRKRARALYDLVTGRRQPAHKTRLVRHTGAALMRQHSHRAGKRRMAGKGRAIALVIGGGLLAGYGLSRFRRRSL